MSLSILKFKETIFLIMEFFLMCILVTFEPTDQISFIELLDLTRLIKDVRAIEVFKEVSNKIIFPSVCKMMKKLRKFK